MQILTDLTEMIVGQSFPPAEVTAVGAGSLVDLGSTGVGDISVGGIVNVGAFSAGTTSMVVRLTECSTTDGSYTAIAGAVTTVTASGIHKIKGQHTYRYIKAEVQTLAATTSSVFLGVAILSFPRTSGGSTAGYSRSPSA